MAASSVAARLCQPWRSGSQASASPRTYVGGDITVNPGTITEFRANFSHGAGNLANIAIRSTELTASVGAVTGNNVGSSIGAAVVGGQVRYWYGANNWANGAVPTTHTLPTVAGATMVDTFTANDGNGIQCGVATNGTTVWQWYAGAGSSSPTVRTITGISGTVLEVQSFPTRSYVRTTTGIYTWATATSGSGDLAAAAVHSGSTTVMSAYGDIGNDTGTSNDRTGVAFVPSTSTTNPTRTAGRVTVVTYSSDGVVTNHNNSSPTTAGTIVQISAGSAGLLAINSNGVLYSAAPAGPAVSRGIESGWTERDSGPVSDIDVWGFQGWFGGLYLKNGVVYQVFGVSGGWGNQSIGGPVRQPQGIVGTVTQIYSSDGMYMALTADGTVWYWFGNNNHNSDLIAKVLPDTGTVVDLGVWACHPGAYYAGGYAIQASDCP